MKIHVTVGDNLFDAEGDFTFDDGLNASLRTWVSGFTPPADQQAIVDALTAKAKADHDALATTIASANPGAPPEG